MVFSDFDDDDFDDDSSSVAEQAPLPSLSDVLYSPANTDGESKRCGNCVFYGYGRGQCALHDNQLRIGPMMVCGYHIYSRIQNRTCISPPGIRPLTPMQSGLEATTYGSSCGNCTYYIAQPEAEDGECVATADDRGLFTFVEKMGSCTRWVPKSIEEPLKEPLIEEVEED